jgi:glycolate oxidase FAD binding subunit
MSESPFDFQPETQDELSRFVSENASTARLRLIPVGGGTALPTFDVANSVQVRLDKLNRVIDYPARDMTITVEAGIRMAELSRILAAENQRLPIDVPQAEQATLGGVIATNWSGPRRFGCGTMRDYVIGISAIDASGRRFSAGGRVVKNVAGYDLCKLLVGSRGELAILTQVTLKLRPVTETSALVWLTFDSLSQIDAVLNRLLTSATRPIALEVLNPLATRVFMGNSIASQPVLAVGFEGSEREVRWQVETLKAECQPFESRGIRVSQGSDAEPEWDALTHFAVDQGHDPKSASATFAARLVPSRTLEFLRQATETHVTAKAHAGNGIVLGHLPAAIVSESQAAGLLQSFAEFVDKYGGSLSLLNCPAEWTSIPREVGGGVAQRAWSEKIRRRLDPHGLFSRAKTVARV